MFDNDQLVMHGRNDSLGLHLLVNLPSVNLYLTLLEMACHQPGGTTNFILYRDLSSTLAVQQRSFPTTVLVPCVAEPSKESLFKWITCLEAQVSHNIPKPKWTHLNCTLLTYKVKVTHMWFGGPHSVMRFFFILNINFKWVPPMIKNAQRRWVW